MKGPETMTDTFRTEYTPLSEKQKAQVSRIKAEAAILMRHFDDAVPVEERSDRSRYMSIARTNLEQTIMWAIKSVTSPQEGNV